MNEDEFQFEQDATNSGRLTYRCMSFNVTSDSDEFDAAELLLIQEMVECLNENFKR